MCDLCWRRKSFWWHTKKKECSGERQNIWTCRSFEYQIGWMNLNLRKNRTDTKSNKSITNTTFCLYKSLTRNKGSTLLFFERCRNNFVIFWNDSNFCCFLYLLIFSLFWNTKMLVDANEIIFTQTINPFLVRSGIII